MRNRLAAALLAGFAVSASGLYAATTQQTAPTAPGGDCGPGTMPGSGIGAARPPAA